MISTKRKRKKSLSASLLCCVAVIVSVQLAYARGFPPMMGKRIMQKTEPSVYDPVPEALRQSLSARLSLVIKYRALGKWADLYELMAASYVKGRSRTQFVEDYSKYPGVAGTGRALVNFVPKTIKPHDTNQEWMIYGCARLRGVKVGVDAFIIASREGGNWHFSDVDMLTPRDTSFTRCAYDRPVQKRRTKR